MFPCPRPEKSTANACPCSLALFLQAHASSNLQYNLLCGYTNPLHKGPTYLTIVTLWGGVRIWFHGSNVTEYKAALERVFSCKFPNLSQSDKFRLLQVYWPPSEMVLYYKQVLAPLLNTLVRCWDEEVFVMIFDLSVKGCRQRVIRRCWVFRFFRRYLSGHSSVLKFGSTVRISPGVFLFPSVLVE